MWHGVVALEGIGSVIHPDLNPHLLFFFSFAGFHKLTLFEIPLELGVMYFNQLLGAACTQKRVGLLFSAAFSSSNSFRVRSAPKSWSKYTTIGN